MNTTEELTEEAYSHGAETIDWKFTSDRIKGLYCDGVIAISDRLTGKEQAAVLAEELGHHLTASGNILDQSVTANRKQELRGRIWAYNRLIGLTGIIRAYKMGCRNRGVELLSRQVRGLHTGRQLCDLLRACSGRDGADIVGLNL